MLRHASPRSASPTPSSSSTFSAATTSATFSSCRTSLSSCRSSSPSRLGSFRGTHFGSSRSYPRASISETTSSRNFFPTPPSWDAHRRRRRYCSARDRSCRRESDTRGSREHSRRRPGKDYASEARVRRDRSRSKSRSRSSGSGSGSGYSRKRGRSSSRERGGTQGKIACVECPRCLERCNGRSERKITRTLPMDYWVRTSACKAAKSRHMDYMDNLTHSREQFIEETVFTCPFTGRQQDVVLERNMFPYDVPTDVEHWTLWSRKDLTQEDMEEFVQNWAAKNHPHVVEWECDNNEGDRSIDWYHVHVFFRVGCEDKTGIPRDPTSAYDGPCGTPRLDAVGNDSRDGEHHQESTATDGEISGET